MNKTHIHMLVGLVLAFFLLTLADLVPFWMPMMGELMALLLVVVLMIFFAGFILQEKAKDEREVELKMKSGRLAYLSGLTALTIGLVLQGLNATIDPWIAIALAVMVLTKLAARWYLE